MKPLPRSFYDRDTALVARELLGKLLVHRVDDTELIGRIVETEAYIGPQDQASHSSKGLTKRTQVMFGPPGHAYVYLIYGMHHCMNVVTEHDGHGAAVLLRAVEPVTNLAHPTNGPGRLCRAMQIDRKLNNENLCGRNIFVAADDHRAGRIVKRPRIGVDYAGSWARRHLRFYLAGNRFVSRP